MSDADLMAAVGVVVGSGVVAEIARRIIPGTKYDSTAVKVLGLVSHVLTIGVTSFFPGDGRKKRK